MIYVNGCAGGDKSPEASAAEQLCSSVAKCDNLELFVSRSECEKQSTAQFEKLDADCYECIADITCAGWQKVSDGDKTECDFCSVCCQKH